MAGKNFLEILDETLHRVFHYDYEISWDKKHFAIEVSFIVGEFTDEKNGENLIYEDAVLFYHPTKTVFDEKDYLAAIPYDETGLSLEFINYFVAFLQETVDTGLEELTAFLAADDNEEEDFSLFWDSEKFESGDETLLETEFYKYPRY